MLLLYSEFEEKPCFTLGTCTDVTRIHILPSASKRTSKSTEQIKCESVDPSTAREPHPEAHTVCRNQLVRNMFVQIRRMGCRDG